MVLAGGVALAVTAAVGIIVAGDDGADIVEPATAQRSSSAIVQAEIDAALAEMSAAASRPAEPSAWAIVQGEIDAALVGRNSAVTVQQPGYLVVQNAIDAALAERNGNVEVRPTAQIVQDEIDAALAAHNGAASE
jgi:C-terminal processing protease CtpA/Prc